MKPVGRPRTSQVSRAEQLRLAKRAQREREREAGLMLVRLKLPARLAKRLAFAAQQKGFEAAVETFLEAETVEIARYPQLKMLCWNRRTDFISALEAWELYERNWRMVDRDRMDPSESALLRVLVMRFGSGVMNV